MNWYVNISKAKIKRFFVIYFQTKAKSIEAAYILLFSCLEYFDMNCHDMI